jgi:uncharacterized membrane protein YoaK (UPF0700 family)
MKIFNREKILEGKDVWPWLLLAFQAGAINSIGYLACHRFVSHVTGFGTRIGIELVNNNNLFAFEMTFKFLFFLFGAFLSGYIFFKLKKEESTKFFISSSIITLFLVIVFALGELGMFGIFGEPLALQRDVVLLCILCFICGTQNGITSIISTGLMRTTHLTGLTTDLGTGLAKFLVTRDHQEKKLNMIRFNLIFFFTLGASISAFAANTLEFKTFIIPILSSMVILGYLFKNNMIYLKIKSDKGNNFESMA